MIGRIKELVSHSRHGRTMRALAQRIDAAETIDLHHLRVLRELAKRQRSRIDRLLFVADSRLSRSLRNARAIKKPMYCDWAYRPEIWRGPLAPPGMSAVETQTGFGEEATIFHDCRISELTLRQLRNTHEADLSPYGLRLDIFRFDGSFMSLVVELPPSATEGLKLTHVIRVDTVIQTEKPLEIFIRLNVKHGPNTEQIVRELPLGQEEVMVEFDLAYSKINEKRIEKMWLDVIFEGPEMNQVMIRDLTITRRPRAEL